MSHSTFPYHTSTCPICFDEAISGQLGGFAPLPSALPREESANLNPTGRDVVHGRGWCAPAGTYRQPTAVQSTTCINSTRLLRDSQCATGNGRQGEPASIRRPWMTARAEFLRSNQSVRLASFSPIQRNTSLRCRCHGMSGSQVRRSNARDSHTLDESIPRARLHSYHRRRARAPERPCFWLFVSLGRLVRHGWPFRIASLDCLC